MALTKQQKRDRAVRVRELGLQGSEALKAVIAELLVLGENELARHLDPAQVMWRGPIAQRVNELEGFMPKRRPLIDNSEHVRELRGQYAVRERPGLAEAGANVRRPSVPRKPVKPLSVVPVRDRRELPDAG
jgi:hypothetical protein